MKKCPDCGAAWPDDRACRDHFQLLLYWEQDYQLYDVHHLTVLCYYLQHPALYSPAGLQTACQMLPAFLEQGVSPQQMRRHLNQTRASTQRPAKVTGTPDAYGNYDHPIAWTYTIVDVTQAGMDHYYDSVRHWADMTLAALRDSGNMS